MGLIVDFPSAEKSGAIDKEKQVQFFDVVQVYTVSNLKANFKGNVWFSREELKLFKARNATTLSRIRLENKELIHYATNNIKDTSRFMGLENYLTIATLNEVMCRRQLYMKAVLDEQQRQIDGCYYDPNEMMRVSEGFSEWSRMRARIIARLHACEDEE